jgi:hypothetical protein
MSAYIVEDDTINKIVGYLETRMRNDDWICRPLFYTVNMREATGAKRLASLMFELNVRAVNDRYGDRGTVTPFQYKRECTNDVKAYKALGCWLYQCTEGDVPDTKLFQAMKKVHANLAHYIVSKLPEYERAKWG